MKKLIEAIKQYETGKKQGDNSTGSEKLYCFDEEFIGFSGHFPGYPILPAVLQLLLAQLFIEEVKGYMIRITSIEKAKFISEIRPGDTISIGCTDADTDLSQRSRVKIMCGERIMSTFNLYFIPAAREGYSD